MRVRDRDKKHTGENKEQRQQKHIPSNKTKAVNLNRIKQNRGKKNVRSINPQVKCER